MKYGILLADADETLLDFHESERLAISRTFLDYGIPDTEEMRAVYHKANMEQWDKLERGETTPKRLRVERFQVFLKRIGKECNPADMSASFVENLSCQGIALAGAADFCKAVSSRMPIIVVTNGLSEVQRGRSERCELRPYISGMVVSEELGVSKPDPAIVNRALELAGISDKSKAILIGDSLTADIPCATSAGVDSILYTRGGEAPAGHTATYTAKTYDEALKIILA